MICDDDNIQDKHYVMLMKRSTVPVEKKIRDEIFNTRLDDLLPDHVVEIETIEYVHGMFDGIFSFRTDGIVNAKKFCERFQERFQPYVVDVELLETIFPIRKQGLRNPNLKKQLEYL